MPIKNTCFRALFFISFISCVGFLQAQFSPSVNQAVAVDFALVLDVSGSMDAASCVSCEDTRLRDMVSATEQIIRTINDLSQALPALGVQHRVSITVFGTEANGYQNAELVDIETNFSAIIAYLNGEVYQQVDRRATSLGAGLLSAIGTIANSTRPTNIILLTDGEQREAPHLVKRENGDYVIQGEKGEQLMMLNEKLNVNFYAVGIGLNAQMERLLTDLSTALSPTDKTRNRTPLLIPVSANKNFVNLALTTQLQRSLSDFGSPQIVDYRWGTLGNTPAKETFLINENINEVSFYLTYSRGSADDWNLRVQQDDRMFSTAEASASWRYEEGQGYKRFVFRPRLSGDGSSGLAGNWTVEVAGNAGNAYQLHAIVDDHYSDYSSTLSPNPAHINEELSLDVEIVNRETPLSGAIVTAYIAEPGESISSLLARTEAPGDTDFRKVNFRNSRSDISKNKNFRYNERAHFYEYFSPGMASDDASNRLSDALNERNVSPLDEKIAVLVQDLDFARLLPINEQIITLEEVEPGHYNATYRASKTGTYTIVYRIQAQKAELGGDYHRLIMSTVPINIGEPADESSTIYVFPYEDPSMLYIRPIDSVGTLLGPGWADDIIVDYPDDNGLAPQAHVQGDMRGGYLIQINGMSDRANSDIRIQLAGHDKPLFSGSINEVYRPLGVHANIGAAIPLGDFAEQVKTGLLAEVGSKYRISPLFGISVRAGYYGFNPNNHLGGITSTLDYALLARSRALKVITSLGGGYYFAKGGDSGFGLNANLEIERPIRPFLTSKLNVGFFNADLEAINANFLTVSLGVERSL